ncbi:hypothetical protein F5Y11DRAFT_193051 [Daldinia sp. FL1419]|nr:hypothetical protein F5Y11DRAFT_193051 [Daldinia sp. FL1419]
MSLPTSDEFFTSADITPVSSSVQIFNHFPALPTELRLKIWRTSMESRQRVVEIHLRNRELMKAIFNKRGDVIPDTLQHERYGVTINGRQTLSKLFRVNRESRDAASSFYRVHVPCWLFQETIWDDGLKPNIFYFNPENDFLYIKTDPWETNDTGLIVEFLHDLKKTHDPRQVGLLNLALDSNGLTGGVGLCLMDPSTPSSLFEASFTDTLKNLREVFFISIQSTGRHVFGYLSGAQTHEYSMNLSFPVATAALNFKRLHTDPRPIAENLEKVFVNSDPRVMLHAWRKFLHKHFDNGDTPQPQLRILLAFAPCVYTISDKGEGERCLKREDLVWKLETSQHPKLWKSATGSSQVKTAFGFWLFPEHAFGPLPEDPTHGFRPERPSYINLKDFWPELGLVDLP